MKRLLFWLVVLFMTIASFATAFAEGEPEVPPPEAKPIAGYDNNFFVQSSSGAFRLNIGMRLQLQHLLERGTTAMDESADNNRTVNTFRIRRARFTFSGTAHEKLDYFLMLQHASGETEAKNILWIAEFTYNFIPEFRITFGQTQATMSRFDEVSSGDYQLIEAPLTASQEDGQIQYSATRPSFGLPTDIGLKLGGDISRFSYSVYFGNGTGEGAYNLNRKFTYATRFTFDILNKVPYKESDAPYSEKPGLTIGMGAAYLDDAISKSADTNNDGTNDVTAAYNWNLVGSGDIAFRWRGFSATTEGFYRLLKVDTATCTGYAECGENKLTDVGYYGQLGYFIIPDKLEIALRAGQIFREGPDNNAYETTGVINWFIKNNQFKLQTAYTRLVDFDNVPGISNDVRHYIRTMFTLNL